MAIARINNDLFFDAEELAYARFEDIDDNPTAFLRFRGGTSETVSGEAARQLAEYLNHTNASRGGQLRPEIPIPNQDGTASPSEEVARPPIRLRAINAFVGDKKGWYHRSGAPESEYFVAFVNAKGSCSMRTWDAGSGIFLGKEYRAGDWQEQFSDFVEGSTRLTVQAQPNLERDCDPRLPDRILNELQSQLKGRFR